ncbi:helicase/secretion neighborhood TadE-like protein [Mycobacterium tuberculosis]|nr:helicase/secretion neighborhood TadE-like protein [Mycobacterium tuberculosis]
MEAALAIATLVLVLVLCLAGVTAVSMQVRCIDAAREAARLAARGDVRSATDVARSIAPRAALVQVHRDGEFVVATVTAHSNLLPTLDIAARAIWVPSRGDRGSATVLAVAMVAVLLCVTGAGAYLGSAVVARHRAQAAADLASLAAAARLPSGLAAACARATLVARAMRVEHAQCRVVDLDVVVTVEVAVAFAGVATATARAGPAKVPTTPG